jgi:hypothetical protein
MLDFAPPTTTDTDKMASKPAKNYLAKAVPVSGGSGFYAQWAAPGMVPDFIYVDRDGNTPRIFEQAAAAEIAALRTMFNALNTRRTSKDKQEVSQKMSGPEFAVKLAEANIGPTLWAQLFGSKYDRVIDQIDGAIDVPFPVHWILEILKDPAALKRAIEITAQNITYKQEFIEYLQKSGVMRTMDLENLTQIPVEMTKKPNDRGGE